MPDLSPTDVHVWTLDPAVVTDPQHRRGLVACLSDDENERAERFRFARDQHMFRVAHGLVRVVLSRYAPVAPAQWRFATAPHGKPELAPGQTELPLTFNLSHTRGCVAVGVAQRRAIGVDVEAVDGRAYSLDVAERFFAPAELAALRALPEAARRDRFFDYWTLKESYIKARGLGLALPLEQFAFALGAEGAIELRVDPTIDDGIARSFWLRSPGPRHRLAVCAERADGDEVAVRLAAFDPSQPP